MMLNRPHSRGLTLIEMLTALVIGTMIIGATAGMFTTTITSWERGSQDYAVIQTSEKIGGLIERHLRSALPPGQDDSTVIFSGEDLSTSEGKPGHRLTLRSSAPGRFPRSLPLVDSYEICFEFDPLFDDGFTMRVQAPPDQYPDEGGYLVALSPLVKGLRVMYFDGREWLEYWSGSNLPLAVEFHLFIQQPNRDGQVPEETEGDSGIAVGQAVGSETVPPSQRTTMIEYSRLVWLPMGKAFSTSGTQQVATASGEGETQSGDTGGRQ